MLLEKKYCLALICYSTILIQYILIESAKIAYARNIGHKKKKMDNLYF